MDQAFESERMYDRAFFPDWERDGWGQCHPGANAVAGSFLPPFNIRSRYLAQYGRNEIQIGEAYFVLPALTRLRGATLTR